MKPGPDKFGADAHRSLPAAASKRLRASSIAP